jgi:K(+)-stimulated pyrophosphate-energized sodium pump
LPNGVAIYVPAYGMESRVIGFIEGVQPVSEFSTFDFDRVTFAQNSARFLPGSQEQLKNVASIMRAYPNVTVRIEGYSDNAGSPVTNLKLSQQRANAVKQSLVERGIASSRMKAEAGGVRNRRVALEITQK